ncbi:hypothetical protein E2562_033656 [Oryza meyeriana var. granulata]|uniref:Uncharacterized protein n=1 Tax=Oryza meyeriana var. granulata TaxID=110450 RepID=A0A6G1C8W4_9ORYZ|nr:hypothetical protein E2562_033656 [Oryza meyeriana var. granulata]
MAEPCGAVRFIRGVRGAWRGAQRDTSRGHVWGRRAGWVRVAWGKERADAWLLGWGVEPHGSWLCFHQDGLERGRGLFGGLCASG